MTTVAVVSATPPSQPLSASNPSDAEFIRRWNEWKPRGHAHEERVRRRARVAVIVTGTVGLAVAAYFLLA